MDCPSCGTSLHPVQYEGIQIETCDACGGEWLDAEEVKEITRIRAVMFSDEERRAVAQSTSIRGVRLSDADRDLVCPKCGATTDAINYGGDTGIILDRCTECGGFWLDAGELEKIQVVAESWEDALPEDMRKYGRTLRGIEATLDREDDIRTSRLPLAGRLVNLCMNGILDLMV